MATTSLKRTTPMTLRIGLVLAALLAVSDLFAFAFGPLPIEVVVAATALGVITLVALVPAWRTGGRTAVLVVAISRIASALLAIPAFFADDVPAGARAGAAVFLVLAVVSAALLFRAMNARSVQHLT
jgi:hypothetical protein